MILTLLSFNSRREIVVLDCIQACEWNLSSMSRKAKSFDQILKFCLFGERGGGSKLWLRGSACIVNSEEGKASIPGEWGVLLLFRIWNNAGWIG